jgi:DNA-3-methyladenine glycosylase
MAGWELFCSSIDLDEKDILRIDFYSRDTALVARELIGKMLVRKFGGKIFSGIIVETEAYYGLDDPASHAFRGKTKRAKIMFGRPGTAYVYFCYGMYYMLNAVTEEENTPGAVLIRAVQPVEGLDKMFKRRKTGDVKNLANGPGKLTAALGIDINDNGKDLTDMSSGLNIYDIHIETSKLKISNSPRIGISTGIEKQLRFYLANSDFISC